MTGKELRNLQEAYGQVYKLDEISQKTATRAFAKRATNEFETDGDNERDFTKSGKSKADETKRRIVNKFGKKAGAHAERAAHREIYGRKGYGGMPPVKEDVYDIILSHLLDEGYAETPEAAKNIMVNMSEEWIDSIVDEVISEGEKPFPYEKVKAKQVALRDKGSAGLDRRMKMGAAVRRAKESEKTGGSQQDAGKGWYHSR